MDQFFSFYTNIELMMFQGSNIKFNEVPGGAYRRLLQPLIYLSSVPNWSVVLKKILLRQWDTSGWVLFYVL